MAFPEHTESDGRTRHDRQPLEATLSELEYNQVLLQGDNYRRDYSLPVSSQFDRAIAANAVGLLPDNAREDLFHTYRLVSDIAENASE